MASVTDYRQAAEEYAEGVRALFAFIGPAVEGRVVRPPIPVADLASYAEAVASRSAALTAAAAADLAADPAARLAAARGLLAKAAADLEISARLLEAAEAEQPVEPTAPRRAANFVTVSPAPEDLDETLGLLLAEGLPQARTRAALILNTVPEARLQLTQMVSTALDSIQEQAARTGRSAFGGLLALGIGELGQALSIVGMDIATLLGQAERISRLYALFREFWLQTYNSLVTLLGPAIAQSVASQAVAWVQDAVNGEKFTALVAQLYETGATQQAVAQEIAISEAELVKFIAAIQDIEGLTAAFRQQVNLAEKVLKGLRFLGGVPAAALPQGRLLLAAAYILLGGYIVLAGADFADARRLKWLNRTPGVHQVVVQRLGR